MKCARCDDDRRVRRWTERRAQGDLAYFLAPLPPVGRVSVGVGVGLITTVVPVWIGMDPRVDLVGVTTTFPPTWIFPGFPPDATPLAQVWRVLSHLLKQAS